MYRLQLAPREASRRRFPIVVLNLTKTNVDRRSSIPPKKFSESRHAAVRDASLTLGPPCLIQRALEAWIRRGSQSVCRCKFNNSNTTHRLEVMTTMDSASRPLHRDLSLINEAMTRCDGNWLETQS